MASDYALHLWDGVAPRGAKPGFERRARTLALKAFAGEQETSFGGIAGGAVVASTWKARAQAIGSYRAALQETGRDPQAVLPALLHMHHVRAFGVDADHEERTLCWVREIARSLLARQKRSA